MSSSVAARSVPNIYENNNDIKSSSLSSERKMMLTTSSNGSDRGGSDTRTTNSPQPLLLPRSTPSPKSYVNVSNHHHNQHQKSSSSPTQSSSSGSSRKPKRNNNCCCGCVHLNNLWSIWYGIIGTVLQAYTAVKCVKRILGYSFLNWPENLAVPYLELNFSLGLAGAAVLLLPLFLIATIFKIGNLANDGFKLGRQLSTCSKEPPAEILTNHGNCRLFRHGGPTAPFVHLVIAFCLLVPKLLLEARLIEAGFLSQDWIWRTDLDFMGLHKDRMVILSFMTTSNNSHNALYTAAQLKGVVTPTSTASITTTTMASIPSASTLLQQLSPPNAVPFTSNSVVTNTVIKTLKDFIGHENHTHHLHDRSVETGWGSSVSVEYINLAVALMVYSVRYPALFWSTNKSLGIIFSFQLFINGVHTLLAYAGMSILYKVQIVGGWKTLPLLKHEATTLFTFNKYSPFVLNPQVTFALYMLSTLLILSSSLVLYLYGHTRFNAFLNQERERRVITLKEGSSNKWSYFTHCAALCVLISVGICNAPLLHDLTVLYRGSLDDTTLACIVGGILHLFCWIVIWLFLTIKQTWIFKLRVTVGRATVRQARSLKLITDIDLMSTTSSSSSRHDDLSQQPLLIVGNGRTYNITETSPKKAIMSVIQKAQMSKKIAAAASNGSISANNSNQHSQQQQQHLQQHQQQQQQQLQSHQNMEDEEEQIYWLRPALVTPQSSPDDTKQLCWFKTRSSKPKNKVTFNETTSTSVNRNKNGGVRGRRITALDEDDGDYATLRELPLPPPLCRRPENREDTVSEEGKLLACVQDEHVTYASNNQDLIPPPTAIVDYEDPSPLLTPEPASAVAASVVVHNNHDGQTNVIPGGQTPRCLRRADSGMPHDELTPRSDSLSTGSSSTTSPPEVPGSNHSETSSGVHSNDSSAMDHHHQNHQNNNNNNINSSSNNNNNNKHTRRATSVVDLVQSRDEAQWKSCSLQRGVQNPLMMGSGVISPPPSSAGSFGTGNGCNNKADLTANSAVILENPSESTVVIRRKVSRPVTTDITHHHQAVVVAVGGGLKEEPFGRATNMRMTSFTEKNDPQQQSSSATLPHFPTAQPVQSVFAHCSTMPLPQHTNLPNGHIGNNGQTMMTNMAAGNSCNVYPRQHTTLPTQYNGVKLFHQGQSQHHSGGGTTVATAHNPYVARFKCKQSDQQGGLLIKSNVGETIYTGINKNGEMYHYNS